MTEYKCIACGHVKESEDTCSCTECGYKMFPTPYDRKTVLASEIQNFIKTLMLSEIKDEYLSYFRMVLKKKAKKEDEKDEYEKILKNTDDKRFPDFNKVQNYICSADKTEKFVERLNSSLDQIEKHIGTPFQMEYETDFEYLEVILAGYKNEMKSMISSNPGLESRIQFTLEFPDYTHEELGQIAIKFLEKKKYSIDSSALGLFLDIAEYYRNRDNFANARTVRNILDRVIMNQNLRTEDDENDDGTIVKSDVEDYLSDEGINLNDKSGGTHRIGFM